MENSLMRIGAGAGFAGDRIEPAVELAEHGALDYLVFECLAERTIALDQQRRLHDPTLGYNPQLEARLRAVLPLCAAKGIKIITNMGSANPQAAGAKTLEIARALGLEGLRVGVVLGDDALPQIAQITPFGGEEGQGPFPPEQLVAANAYLGAEPLVEALTRGTDIVVTGRVADPSLFLAPMIYTFNWVANDWPRLGAGTIVAHLLECAGQVTGGYFADPGYKDVPGLSRLGFPLAEVSHTGEAVITKVKGSGGLVTLATCKEQLLYEVHDPAAYQTPDVTADFTGVTLKQVGQDRVKVSGGWGRPRPAKLKVSLAYRGGFVGEGQISYAGPRAYGRAQLAGQVVRERLDRDGVRGQDVRIEFIGVNSLHRTAARMESLPGEVRLRVVACSATPDEAARVGNEVEALLTCGPAGGGGLFTSVREIIAVTSGVIPREAVRPTVQILETRVYGQG